MSDARVRFVEFERGQIDMETGEFPMILASDGEASDGDILSIEGAQFTSRAPLQISHVNDPRATAGSVSGFRRDLMSSPKKLKARGQIELGGEGPSADIRRDLAFMVNNGHVTGISVRWEPLEYMRRTALPKEHPAYVKEDEPDYRKRYGFYHKRWRVLEGSIVAVQADKEALIGRAQHWTEKAGAESEQAGFYRAMAEIAAPREQIETQARQEEPKAEPIHHANGHEVKPPTPDSLKAAFAAQVRELKAAGLSLDDLDAVIEEQREPESHPDPLVRDLVAKVSSLEAELRALEEQRVSAAPLPAIRTAQDMLDQLEAKLAASRERVLGVAKAAVDARRGKVSPGMNYRQALHADVDALIRDAKAEESGEAAKLRELAGLAQQLEVLVTAARARHEAAQRQKDKS